MLNVMRKHAGSWMIKVILFAIVIVFVFWGVGSFRSRQASKVATVNGELITLADYQRTYNNLIDQYRQRFGASLNDSMLEMLQVKRQAVDQLVNRALMLQEAQRLGLGVSDSEVADFIRKIPAFQTNGTFDSHRYRSLLSSVHLSPEEFEAEQKNALLIEKLTRIIMGAAKVSGMEVQQYYDWQNTSVDVDYVLFKPEDQKDITITDAALADYFSKNKEQYKTEPMVKAEYVVFDPAALADQVTVTDDEIRDYYDAHMDEFSKEKTVEARHILIRVPPDADAATDEAAKAKAQEIADKAKAGEDFAELARTYSEGPTKDRGGELGEFTRSQMVKPFADKAFSMAPGEISEPVKTQFGYHVIKVEKVNPAKTETLDQARGQIVKILTERKARNLAYDRAEQFYDTTFDQENLAAIAKKEGLKVVDTGAFSRRGPDALGKDKSKFASIAFSLQKDEISDIQEIGNRFYLIEVTDRIDAKIPELAAVKSRVSADLKKKIQRDKARAEAEKMAAELKQGQSLEALAEKMGLSVKDSGLFKRDAAVPAVGSDRAFIQAAFELKADGDVTEKPVAGSAGFYLLRLKKRQQPDPDGLAQKEAQIKDMLLSRERQTVFQDWLEARKGKSDITIAPAYMQ